MNSRWFEARQSLLFAKSDLAGTELRGVAELHTISLVPDRVAASVGEAILDPDCAEPRQKFAYWVGKGNWVDSISKGPEAKGRLFFCFWRMRRGFEILRWLRKSHRAAAGRQVGPLICCEPHR